MNDLRKQTISATDPKWVWQLKEQLNRIIDELARVEVRGDGTTTRVEKGVVTAFGAGDFPGLVYVGGNRFYDADRITGADAVGEAIVDNSTDGAKEWLKVAVSAAAITDTASLAVSYEDGAPAHPWPAGEYWFEVARWSTPISVNHLVGAQEDEQFYGRRDGVLGFYTVEIEPLPSPSDAGQVLAARVAGAVDHADLEFIDLPPGFTMPSGVLGDLYQCKSGTTWEKISGWQVDDMMLFDAALGWVPLRFSTTYPAVIFFDPSATPAIKVVEPSSSAPGAFSWQPADAELQFVELDSQFKYIGRGATGRVEGDYIRVT